MTKQEQIEAIIAIWTRVPLTVVQDFMRKGDEPSPTFPTHKSKPNK